MLKSLIVIIGFMYLGWSFQDIDPLCDFFSILYEWASKVFSIFACLPLRVMAYCVWQERGSIISDECDDLGVNSYEVQRLTRDGLWPNPTRAYFKPAVNKRLTHLWPGYFLTRPNDIFLSEGEKIEFFCIFRENFPNAGWLTRPNPDQKILTRIHHYG